MTLRLYSLWDGRKSVLIALWIGFAVTYTGVLVSFGTAVPEIFGKHPQYLHLVKETFLTCPQRGRTKQTIRSVSASLRKDLHPLRACGHRWYLGILCIFPVAG